MESDDATPMDVEGDAGDSPCPSAQALEEEEKIKLEILGTIVPAQNSHGMRHGHYRRYRDYCTARIRRLRVSLKMTNGPKRYNPKKVTVEKASTGRHVLIPLFQAERAWSFAMELKEEIVAVGEDASRKKYHMLRRFRKAAVFAKHVEEICAAKGDSMTALEAEAYSSSMTGNTLLEREDYSNALEKFARASTIYSQLAKFPIAPSLAFLFTEKVSQLEPSIRYCNLRTGGEGDDISSLVELKMKASGPEFDLLNAKLEAVLSETRAQQTDTLNEIVFRGENIPVKHDAIRVALLESQDRLLELNRLGSGVETEKENSSGEGKTSDDDRMQAYTKLFISYNDTLDAIRTERKKLEATEKMTQKKEASDRDLKRLETYCQWMKLSKTLDRNLFLISQSEEAAARKRKEPKPDDLVRLYENLMQNITELESLCEETDLETQKQLKARSLTFKSIRCFYVGCSYVRVQKWSEAMILMERCSDHIKRAREHQQDCKSPNPEDIARLKKVELKVSQQCSIIKANYFLATAQAAETGKGKEAEDGGADGPLIDRLHCFDPDSVNNLVEMPPGFSPMPVKPIVYDLALSEVTFPDISDRVPKKSGGIWGFFSRS